MDKAIELLVVQYPWLAWVFAFAPGLAVTLVALWTIWSFSAAARVQARKPFLEKQLQYCVEAVDAAAILSTADIMPTFGKARIDFERLYWDVLAMAADKEVENAMKKFKTELDIFYEANIKSQEQENNFVSFITGDRQKLQEASLKLSHAVRRLTLRSWRLALSTTDALEGWKEN